MSRFDDELVKQADNAYQQRVGEGAVTTPRQVPYNQVDTINLDSGFGAAERAPEPVDEVADWAANQPMSHQVDVQDLDATEMGEIIGGPGSSAVYAEGGPVYAKKDPIDESLYNVYKASREIRDAIETQIDFDFSNLVTASNDAATVLRFASADNDINQVIGTVAGIVLDIESDLATTGDYRQASADLEALEGLVDDINKFAAKKDEDEEEECKNCKGKGCDKCKGKKSKKKASAQELSKEATNGNQETLQIVDVRDLDDQAGVWDRDELMAADHKTDVQVPEEVNGEDAGLVASIFSFSRPLS